MDRPDDAALLAEAEKFLMPNYVGSSIALVARLSTALRSALQREQELQAANMALVDGWQKGYSQGRSTIDDETRRRAEAAERELSTLRARKEQEDTRFGPPERAISPDQRIDDRER